MTDWKRKLAAYLHDPPSKCLDIQKHGERSDSAFHRAGFIDSEIGQYFSLADHTAAAADRLPFPRSRAAALSCVFDGVRNAFLHPLSGERLPFHSEFRSVEEGFEAEGTVQPAVTVESLSALPDEALRWRARFFAHWRLWPAHAAQKDYRMALLPADTRIPDHSIWSHMQVVSALDGCADGSEVRPAFLKVQLGPVQEFIAAARSTRDLWSGSYLLSWLMAAGMKALSAEVGPDAIIFPNLRGQPLFDLHWRKELWSELFISHQKNIWKSLAWSQDDLLTPNLPNVFLAIVPAVKADDLARKVANAVQKEWQRIADSVWKACDSAGLTADERNERGETIITVSQRRERFTAQVNRFLSLSWKSTPWPETLEEALKLAEGFHPGMPVTVARTRVEAVVNMAEKDMPEDHRDGRFYIGGSSGPKEKLSNVGLGWSIILALNSWELDATRQTRFFNGAGTGGWQIGTFSNKDSLTGREEAVAGGREWMERAKSKKSFWPSLFKKPDWLSAATLIKRVWHKAYLDTEPWNLRTGSGQFPMPNTRGIAAHDPFAHERGNDEESAQDVEDLPAIEKYFAVLAFDGDEIGRWISGEKTPSVSTQLASYTDGSGISSGALEYFIRTSAPDEKGSLNRRFVSFREAQRPLCPSYHLQFSEALSNFALLCARPIVEAFDGRLIYAGGDDVLALLPADTALACGEALRMAFQGSPFLSDFLKKHAAVLAERNRVAKRSVSESQELAAGGRLLAAAATTRAGTTSTHAGFVVRLDDLDRPIEERCFSDHQSQPIPFLVPGSDAECSVGIAIAHFKAPLQDVVREAQRAEKRAKRKPDEGGLGRKAVAVTLMKRSGEIVEWGAKWKNGLELYDALADAMETRKFSTKFPHRLAELLEAYITASSPLIREKKNIEPVNGFSADKVISREFDHCLSRQRGPAFPASDAEAGAFKNKVKDALDTYLGSLNELNAVNSEKRLQFVVGLCQAVAFTHRIESETAETKTEVQE